jgi:hypothetical protein
VCIDLDESDIHFVCQQCRHVELAVSIVCGHPVGLPRICPVCGWPWASYVTTRQQHLADLLANYEAADDE